MLRQLLLEIVDLRVSAHPVGLLAEPLDALDQHAPVPGAVENRKPPAPRDVPPETPQVRLCALFLGRRGDGNALIAPRIQRPRDAANRTALAGGVIALEYRNHRHLLQTRIAEQLIELSLPVFELLLIFLLLQHLVEPQRADHIELVGRRQQRRIAVGQARHGLLVEPFAQRRQQRAPDRQAAVARFGAGHHQPRCLPGAGLAHKRFAHRVEVVVVLEQLPILFGDTPAGIRILFEFAQPFFLLRLGQVKPEFQQQHTFVHEHALKPENIADMLVELPGADASGDPLDDGLGMPAAEKNADLALGRQCAPIAPDARAFILFIGGFGKSAHFNVPGIHPLTEQIDRFTLARALNTRDEDQRGEFAALLQVVLRIEQRFAQLRLFTLVSRLLDAV